MTLQEYFDDLARHDWFHQWSDDYSVVLRGERDRKRLEALAEQSDKHYEVYCAWLVHFSNRVKRLPSQAPKHEDFGLVKPEPVVFNVGDTDLFL